MSDRARILFLAGSGRSGSTILGQTLGEIPGWLFCGELRLGFRVLAANFLCACGSRTHRCAFWRAVIEDAFGTFDVSMLERAVSLTKRVALNRHALLHLCPIEIPRFRRESAEYADIATRVYASILRISGADIVVDTSKLPAYYLAMRNGNGVDLRLAHVVRDSRAVAFSNRRKMIDPANPNTTKYMPEQSLALTAIAWDCKNAFINVILRGGGDSILVRYEDFVAAPNRQLNRLIKLMGCAQSPPEIQGDAIAFGTNHSLAGNPVRFGGGLTRLRLDDEWRSAMAPLDRAFVTALTWPMLAAYGYLGRAT